MMNLAPIPEKSSQKKRKFGTSTSTTKIIPKKNKITSSSTSTWSKRIMRILQSDANKFNCLYGNGDVFEYTKDDLITKGIDIYWINLATSTRKNVYIKK